MKELIEKALEQHKKYPALRQDLIGIVDFTISSRFKRFYLVDVNSEQVLEAHHTAHGSGSADPSNIAMAIKFSNINMSKCSSKGNIRTGDTYIGKHGKSLLLHGLEKGINDNIRSRSIVVHSSNYVTDAYISQKGRCGLSWGCLAIDPAISSNFIDKLKNDIFIYCHTGDN